MLGATDAAKDHAVLLNAMTDHAAATVPAGRRQRVNRALEGIKDVFVTIERHGERLVVFIAAHFAFPHGRSLLEKKGSRARILLSKIVQKECHGTDSKMESTPRILP